MGRLLTLCFFSPLLILTSGLAQIANIKPGMSLDVLVAGQTHYSDVTIKSITPRSVVFLHRGGMASVRLRDLSPEWQARFQYDPATEAVAEATLAHPPRPSLPAAKPSPPIRLTEFERILQQFGQPVVLKNEVDLRPRFFDLGLTVKDQGRRPSCAIFAVVSALEFQNAQLTGRAEKFSEEYLSWAVRKTVQRPSPATAVAELDDDRDDGFALSEVVAALRAYGIPTQARMPNTFGTRLAAIQDPPAEIVQEAREHQHVYVHPVPGRDGPTLVNNVVHALNAGLPVAVGMAWPHHRTLRNAYLDAQKPLVDSGHAVTLVGYRTTTGRLEDAKFIFKNSWGASWGQGGYGIVTYHYLSQHLHNAILLEVQLTSLTKKS